MFTWYVYDIDGNSQSYWIERNGVIISEGTWNNNTNIIFIETEILNCNIYVYTCFINDSLSLINQSSNQVKINSHPISQDITQSSNNIYDPYKEYLFNCSWIDLDGTIEEVKFEISSQNYTVLNNFSGEFSIILNHLAANENGYNFRWHAKDNDGAWNSTDWQVFYLNKKYVNLLILFNSTENNYFDFYNPIINTTILDMDLTYGNLKLYVDRELWQEETGYLLMNISQHLYGGHNITVILMHENYTGYEMKCLNIQETIDPEILFEFSNFYINETQPECCSNALNITCEVNDHSPLIWVYLCENSSGIFENRSMISLENGKWMYILDISGLIWNEKVTFSFFADDTWSNIGSNDNSSYLYHFKIYDFQSPNTKLFFIPHKNTIVVNKSTTFILIANDDLGSGILITRYKLNDSAWMEYSDPFSLSNFNFGYYNLSYYSIDIANNIEKLNWIIINLIDTSTPPPGFNIIDFLLSPLGIAIMSGAVAIIIGVSIGIAKLKPKNRLMKEKKRLDRLRD